MGCGISPTVSRSPARCRVNTYFRVEGRWVCFFRKVRYPTPHRLASGGEPRNLEGGIPRFSGSRLWSRWRRAGGPATPLSDDGKPMEWRSKRYKISFRLGVIQSDKMRACDALKRSMANLARTIEKQIKLVSCDNIAQISHLLSAEWGRMCDVQKRPQGCV